VAHALDAKLCFSTLIVAAGLGCNLVAAGTGAIIDVKLSPALRKYCHVIGFPQGWKFQPFDTVGQRLTLGINHSDYEFRVEGLLGNWFLVGAFTPDVTEHHNEATNYYRVKLSDATAPVLLASPEDWKAATIVPLMRKFQAFGTLNNDQPVVFNGLRLTKSGAWWSNPGSVSRLSPDSAWLVLQSVTDAGTSKLTKRYLYKLFLDVFNAATGEKILTIDGTYSDYDDDPSGALRTTAWLTEKYFIVPLGEHRAVLGLRVFCSQPA
jgi:hypothetical protein